MIKQYCEACQGHGWHISTAAKPVKCKHCNGKGWVLLEETEEQKNCDHQLGFEFYESSENGGRAFYESDPIYVKQTLSIYSRNNFCPDCGKDLR